MGVYENLKLVVEKCYQVVIFNKTKIGGKCPNSKIQCVILGDFQTLCARCLKISLKVSFSNNKKQNTFWWFSTTVHVASEIWRSLFLRYVFSFLFINLTLASTGFVLRPQIQRGKIGWMLAKKVGSERGRTQSPAHSVKRKPKKLPKNAKSVIFQTLWCYSRSVSFPAKQCKKVFRSCTSRSFYYFAGSSKLYRILYPPLHSIATTNNAIC